MQSNDCRLGANVQKKLRPGKGAAFSGMVTTTTATNASIHGPHVSVRDLSSGVDGATGGDLSSRWQQQGRGELDVPQQHDWERAQPDVESGRVKSAQVLI